MYIHITHINYLFVFIYIKKIITSFVANLNLQLFQAIIKTTFLK